MMNYRVDPGRVAPFVPKGCEVDFHRGETYVSVVGFLFQNTRLKGVPVPWHQNFEEVNLRYYIRRKDDPERRAVGFIQEIVPRWAVAAVARLVYQENYVALPMRHRLDLPEGGLSPGSGVAYGWKKGGRWHGMSARISGPLTPLVPGSHPEFIAEHYWGYVSRRDGSTTEYQVEHPPWKIWPVEEARLDMDVRTVYGEEWAEVFAHPPVSAFVAQGSKVTVYEGSRLKPLP